jgi:hypothetical protein
VGSPLPAAPRDRSRVRTGDTPTRTPTKTASSTLACVLTLAFMNRFADIDAFQRSVYVFTLMAAALTAVLLHVVVGRIGARP